MPIDPMSRHPTLLGVLVLGHAGNANAPAAS